MRLGQQLRQPGLSSGPRGIFQTPVRSVGSATPACPGISRVDGRCTGCRSRGYLAIRTTRRAGGQRTVVPADIFRRRHAGVSEMEAASGEVVGRLFGRQHPRRPPAARRSPSGAGSWGSKGGAAPPCQTAMFNIAWAGLGSVTVLSQLPHRPGRPPNRWRSPTTPIPANMATAAEIRPPAVTGFDRYVIVGRGRKGHTRTVIASPHPRSGDEKLSTSSSPTWRGAHATGFATSGNRTGRLLACGLLRIRNSQPDRSHSTAAAHRLPRARRRHRRDGADGPVHYRDHRWRPQRPTGLDVRFG